MIKVSRLDESFPGSYPELMYRRDRMRLSLKQSLELFSQKAQKAQRSHRINTVYALRMMEVSRLDESFPGSYPELMYRRDRMELSLKQSLGTVLTESTEGTEEITERRS